MTVECPMLQPPTVSSHRPLSPDHKLTPPVILPPSGHYPKFSTNYSRAAALELTKRLDTTAFTRQGFMLQAIAAGWHHKSADQLAEIGDKVGRERILVIHGTNDNTITVPHGRRLIELLNPGVGVIRDGMGHVPMIEEEEWCHGVLVDMFEKVGRLEKEGIQ